MVERYDAILSTIPPQALAPLGGPALPPVPYQGAACLTLGMEEECTNGIYWLNMKDPGPFGAVITHTNFVPFNWYGEHIVYLASYFSGTLPGQAGTLMRDEFCKRFSIPSSSIHWERLTVEPYGGACFYHRLPEARSRTTRKRASFLQGCSRPSNYPERSMEGSVSADMMPLQRSQRETRDRCRSKCHNSRL